MNDRDLLRQIRAQIDAHLSAQGDGTTEPPMVPPIVPGGYRLRIHDGDGQLGPAGQMLPKGLTVQLLKGGQPVEGQRIDWTVTGPGRIHPSLIVTNAQGGSQVGLTPTGPGEIRVRASHISGEHVEFRANVGTVVPEPPPVVVPPSGGAPWDGADFPARIMEGRSSTGVPVAITLTPQGYASRTFTRQAIGGTLDLLVPRGVDLDVHAHFTSAQPGRQTTLKLKGLPRTNLEGLTFDNWSSWEPTYLWGHEQTPQGGHGGDVRRYTVPGWIIDGRYQGLPGRQTPGQTLQSLVIAVMDHGAPAG